MTPEITLFVVIMKNPTCFVSVIAQKLIPTCILLNSRGHCCSLFCFSSSCFNVPEHEAFLTLSQDRQFDNLMHFISTVKKKRSNFVILMKAVLHNPAIQGTKARLTVNYGPAAH